VHNVFIDVNMVFVSKTLEQMQASNEGRQIRTLVEWSKKAAWDGPRPLGKVKKNYTRCSVTSKGP
jgi:hypothetical protein